MAKEGQQDLPIIVHVCRRGRRRKSAPCDVPNCNAEHQKLCDYPLGGKKAGQTCDKKICDAHATSVGHNKDYCPPHAKLAERKGERG